MNRSRNRQPHNSRTALIAIIAVCVTVLGLPAGALAARPSARASATKVVHYDGVKVTVPAGWPIFHLNARSRVCVRFNRHAVYLGTPGSAQDCPLQAAGRTEAILIAPAGHDGRLASISNRGAGPAGGSMVRLVDRGEHLVITATWGRSPAVIRRALHMRSLRRAVMATDRQPKAASSATLTVEQTLRSRELGHEVSPASPATPGEIYSGFGFDACTTPSQAAMSAWAGSSPFGAVGVYIGGTNAACPWGNLSASWVSADSVIGWHMIPIYVGLQAPGNSCGCAAMSSTKTNGVYSTASSQGTAAALDAVTQAQALGIGTGNPLYFDMEGYTRSTTASGAVLAFLQAWTEQLHASGYKSGVYSSGASGITDLVDAAATGYAEPDELWIADWSTSSTYVPSSTSDPYVPAGDWSGNQRLIQYYGGHTANYGGVKLSVDSDYLDAATAAAGSGTAVAEVTATPSISVKPQANGSVNLTPSWSGEAGITGYAILAGNSPTALTSVSTVSATAKLPVKLHAVYAYYEVQGLNSLGEVVGTSPPVATPGSVAIFGNSAYVGATGPVGVPAACLNVSPCQVQASIYEGKRRLAQSPIRSLTKHGGQLLVPLSTQLHRMVSRALNRRLPVSVTLTSSSGARATRALNLVSYTVSGRAPTRHIWASSSLQILGETSFVSDAWTGGVLAVCKSATPCLATTRVTLAGETLAAPKTQTLGAGELGYLTYRLNTKGHDLLRASRGNQLGARLTVTTTAASTTGAAATSADPKIATALLSLDSFR